ncbi:unnamed protein product [Sphagnum balticum]
MLVKPSGHFDHVEPVCVTNEKALALFVRDEVLLPTKIRYEQCKCRVERVGNGQVKRLHTLVELVGPAPNAHEPGLGYAMDGQKVEVMHSGFVADADANIPVRGHHVGRHVERDKERPTLS